MNTCTNGSATPLVERGTTLGVVPMGPREKHPLPWPEVAAPRESPHSCGDPDRDDQQAADGHQARRPEREGKAEHGDHGEREPGARRHRSPGVVLMPPRSAPRRTGWTCVDTRRKGRPPPPPSTSPRRPPPARYGRTAPGRVPTPPVHRDSEASSISRAGALRACRGGPPWRCRTGGVPAQMWMPRSRTRWGRVPISVDRVFEVSGVGGVGAAGSGWVWGRGQGRDRECWGHEW